MTANVVTVSPSMSVVEVAKEMIAKKKGPLPVVEGDRVVAMVTDRDMVARVVAASRDPNTVRCEEIATKDLVTIGPDQDLQEARRLLAEHQLDRLLVVEEGDRLVGILSEADLRQDEGPLASPGRRPDAAADQPAAATPSRRTLPPSSATAAGPRAHLAWEAFRRVCLTVCCMAGRTSSTKPASASSKVFRTSTGRSDGG
jgi:CBS-domain-containing membrane protein